MKNQSEEPKKERKYFEVWGDTLNLLNFFKTLTVVLTGIIVLLIILLRIASTKPPIVVKVDSLGNAVAFDNWKSDASVTKPEIINFSQYFLNHFIAYNFYTYDANFKKAFSMMTQAFQPRADRFLEEGKIIDKIKEAQMNTDVNISKIDVLKDTASNVIVRIKGYKTIKSYLGKDFNKEQIFEIELVLTKTKRTKEQPWGLLVDDFKEELIK